MAETHKTEANHKAVKVPEFLREPLEAAQARLEAFEEEAQRLFKDLVQKGRESRKDFQDLVTRLSKQDWRLDEFKGRLEKLRDQGFERAQEWRDRAENFRAEALDRLVEMQTRAVSFLGVATREQVEELSRELDRLAKRMEKGERARRGAKKGAKRASAEV